MSILTVEHLKKYYEMEDVTTKAVDDVSFSVDQGEFVAIIGTSGSGKSTLIHMLGGVDTPSDGSIFIKGVELNALKGDKHAIFRRQNLSIIYQFYNLIPVLNVEENITLPAKLDHRIIDQEELSFIINLLNLQDRMDHLPSQLSGGQQQRVAIARSLVSKPAIILADEPTGNLDKTNSKEIIDYFCKINEMHQQTIIMVTHDLQIAQQAKRILVMEDGKIIEDKAVHHG